MKINETADIDGLTADAVVRSRELHGSNRLPSERRSSLHVAIGVLKEPMLLLLLAACSLYFIAGEPGEGIILLVALGLVAGISVFQEVRSEKALAALSKLTKPKAKVLRNGKEFEIESEDVVVGDLVRIAEGDSIPADGYLVQLNDLSLNESLLTGESMPVDKQVSGAEVFAGTTVSRGSGLFRVAAVGAMSRLGRLGASIRDVEEEKTVLQQQVARFVKGMAFIGIAAFIFVWAYHYFLTRDLMHSLFHGLTLAMSVIPEEIPVAVSVFMALGSFRLISKRVLSRRPQTVEALGAATVICVDKTGTITCNRMTVSEYFVFDSGKTVVASDTHSSETERELIVAARLASELEAFDAMEQAIIVAAERVGVTTDDYRLKYEYPLSGRYPMMTHVWETLSGERVVFSKGSPEGVMACCNLAPEIRDSVLKHVADMARKGFRVLAVARGLLPASAPLPDEQQAIPMRFIGLIGLSDPVKDNIPEVLGRLRAAGIDVKMVTGDYPMTACHIAAVAGFPRPNRYLTGDQVNDMDDRSLAQAVRDVDVFARAMPETKLRLIRALKSNTEVVAMTGDGVNDAPALKAAHIGVAMGKQGTEVARQASSLVLLDDDLVGMVDAVAMGRKIYANLKKAIQYIIAIHVPVLSVVLLPLAFGWPYLNLFTPVHVIFLELVMGPTCSIVFENEPMEPDLMSRRPRKFSVAFFTWRELSVAVLQGLVVATGLMYLVYSQLQQEASEETVRTVVFLCLICSNIFLTLTGRSRDYSVLTTLRFRNRLLPVILSVTLIFLLMALIWPPAAGLFGFVRLPLQLVAFSVFIAFVSVIWIEFTKRW
ncbi:MAG: hypothetical protein RL021_1632 [Bacteroidota bacterium]|jgi:Ca2+-transporting ATPase